MGSLKEIVDYAKDGCLNKNSRVLNVTHSDLDGIVSTINLVNYFENTNNFFYVQKNYNDVNEFFRDILFEGNCSFKNPDWVIITDLSIDESTVEECQQNGINLLILDHHPTAEHLNKFPYCHVDDSELRSGAEVVFNFLECMGASRNQENLKKLNHYTTLFDLGLCRDEKYKKFKVLDTMKSIPEMLNTLYFNCYNNKDHFIKRWKDGWSMFRPDEIEKIKYEQQVANDHIERIHEDGLVIDIADDKVLVLSSKCIVSVCEYFLVNKKKTLVLTYNFQKKKVSGRVHDDCKINIGKIFETLYRKTDFVTNGGGHGKAGGCNLNSNDNIDNFVQKVLKLCEYYE